MKTIAENQYSRPGFAENSLFPSRFLFGASGSSNKMEAWAWRCLGSFQL